MIVEEREVYKLNKKEIVENIFLLDSPPISYNKFTLSSFITSLVIPILV